MNKRHSNLLSNNEIALLGNRVAYHAIKTDPDRVQPLLDMSVLKTNKRYLGASRHYPTFTELY